jgi:hypothetical protein
MTSNQQVIEEVDFDYDENEAEDAKNNVEKSR